MKLFKTLKKIRALLVVTVLLLGLFVYINYGLSFEASSISDMEINSSNYEAQKVQEQEELGDKIGQILYNLYSNLFTFHTTDNKEQNSDMIIVDGTETTQVDTLEAVTLEYVIDGDTVIVTDANGYEFKVRLIGLDTAESVHEDEERNTIYGTYASDYTKQLLSSTDTLYLEYDIEMTDDYGRTLAYVWLTDNTNDCNNMLNYVLLRDGYAYHKEFEPNVKYSELFSSTCNHAMNINAGLWSYEEFDALWN